MLENPRGNSKSFPIVIRGLGFYSNFTKHVGMVPKMEGSSSPISCMYGYGLCKGKPTPKIALFIVITGDTGRGAEPTMSNACSRAGSPWPRWVPRPGHESNQWGTAQFGRRVRVEPAVVCKSVGNISVLDVPAKYSRNLTVQAHNHAPCC